MLTAYSVSATPFHMAQKEYIIIALLHLNKDKPFVIIIIKYEEKFSFTYLL